MAIIHIGVNLCGQSSSCFFEWLSIEFFVGIYIFITCSWLHGTLNNRNSHVYLCVLTSSATIYCMWEDPNFVCFHSKAVTEASHLWPCSHLWAFRSGFLVSRHRTFDKYSSFSIPASCLLAPDVYVHVLARILDHVYTC